MPINLPLDNADTYHMKRDLDCKVVQTLLQLLKANNTPIDTIRASFEEGEAVYPRATFKALNHTQICVVNPHMLRYYATHPID